MIRLDPTSTRKLLTGSEGPRRKLALEHAALWGRPGFWGDHALQPRGIVWVRQGEQQLEVFAIGEAQRAVDWLKSLNQPIAILAPRWWEHVVRDRFGLVERSHIETWSPEDGLIWAPHPRIQVERLTLDEEASFTASAPDWALRAWPSFSAMMGHGAAFGVRHAGEWVALAWVVERSPTLASMGVFVREDLRRLSLGKAVCMSLGTHLVETGATPIWVTHLSNGPSRSLAKSLGMRPVMAEPLLRALPRSLESS